MILGAFRAGLVEIFTLRAARANVDAYTPSQLASLREEKRIARAKLTASRRLSSPFVALDLLTLAAEHARRARLIAVPDSAEEIEGPPPDARASFAQAEAARDELDARVTDALARLESRTPTELAGLRFGRFAAIAVVLLVAGVAVARTVGVHNVARKKPVQASSIRAGKPEALVDGRTRGVAALQTADQQHPFVTIDLTRSYLVRSIRVYNRGDGWYFDVLPLSVEVSTNGSTFREVGRRTEHFDVWVLDFSDAPVEARFVRVTKDNGYIALDEIEVYARE